MAGLVSVGLLEKDMDGDTLWTWVYPSISLDLRKAISENCCLTWDTSSANVPFVYTQFRKQWIHLRTTESHNFTKVTHICLVLITSDFNPPLYSSLADLLVLRYLSTTTPVTVLEAFLQVTMKGCCVVEDSGTPLNVRDYDVMHFAMSESKVKNIVKMFGIEFIIVFTALLLKKRIAIHHSDIAELAAFCRSLPVFVWHRLNWNSIFPLVHLSNAMIEDLSQVTGGYVAGFTDAAIETRTDLYDVFISIQTQEISIAPHAKESLVMGKLHKDLATFLIQCTQDDAKSDAQCIKEITLRTTELVKSLRSLGVAENGGDGIGEMTASISADVLRAKRLPPTTESFLLGLASAEGLLKC